MKQNKKVFLIIGIILIVGIAFILFKQGGKKESNKETSQQQEQRVEKQTKSEVKTEFPVYPGAELHYDYEKNGQHVYNYSVFNVDAKTIQDFYIDYLKKNGWDVKRFRTGSYGEAFKGDKMFRLTFVLTKKDTGELIYNVTYGKKAE